MIDSPSAVTAHAERPAASGYRRGFDLAFGYLMGAFVVAVVVQIFLAGLGAYHQDSYIDSGTIKHGAFDPHENLGHILGIAGVVLFILALVAWHSVATVVWAFVLGLLSEVAQEGLAHGGHHAAWVGGLHAADAALILGIAVYLFLRWLPRRTQRQRTV